MSYIKDKFLTMRKNFLNDMILDKKEFLTILTIQFFSFQKIIS